MLRLKVPQRKLEEGLLAMIKYRDQTDIWVMGVNHRPQQSVKELLYHDRLENTDTTRISRLNPGFAPVLVRTSARLSSRARQSFLLRVSEMPVEAGLLFVTGRDTMEVFCVVKSGEDGDGSVILSIPGPNMEQLILSPLDTEKKSGEKRQTKSAPGADGEDGVHTNEQEWRKRHDRLAAAVGLGDMDRGFELLARARRLVVVIIGTGRAGSRLAFRLGQSGIGVEGALILVDPDTTGPENLEGMIVAREAVGFPKVYGVGRTLAAITGGIMQPMCLYASLSDPEVLDVLRMADVVFTAVDESSARLATAVVASRYHILHIDLTGGLAWTGQKHVVAGGELRAFIPGSRGCLACQDRYDWREALQLLGLSGETERRRREGLDWYKQRPGSNVDILLPVIGEAMQSFWGILRGEVKHSFWWHYEKDHQGRPVWSDWSNRHARGKCNICGKQAGLGDITG